MLIRSLEKKVEEGSRRIWQDSGLVDHCRVSDLVPVEESSEGKPPLNPHHNIHLDKPEASLEVDEELFGTSGETKGPEFPEKEAGAAVVHGRGDPSCSGLVLRPMAWETFHGELEEC